MEAFELENVPRNQKPGGRRYENTGLKTIRGNAKLAALLMATFFLTTMIWGMLLHESTLSLFDFLEFDLELVMEKISSPIFIAFLLTFSVPWGFALALMDKVKEKDIVVTAIIGYGIAILLLTITSPVVASYIYAWIMVPLAMLAMVKYGSIRLSEFKHMRHVRAFYSASGYFMLIVGVGVFMFGVITILPAQQMYAEKLENTLLKKVNVEPTREQVRNIVARDVNLQRNLLTTIMASPQFSALGQSDDNAAKAFVAMMFDVWKRINSEEYLEEQTDLAIKEKRIEKMQLMDAKEAFEQRVIFYPLIKKYLWFVYSILLMSLFMFIATLVFRPLAVLYGLLFDKLTKHIL
jgi:hypothetical protein